MLCSVHAASVDLEKQPKTPFAGKQKAMPYKIIQPPVLFIYCHSRSRMSVITCRCTLTNNPSAVLPHRRILLCSGVPRVLLYSTFMPGRRKYAESKGIGLSKNVSRLFVRMRHTWIFYAVDQACRGIRKHYFR